MMERIKKGIVLKPVSRQQVCRLSRHALRGQKSFSFTTVFNVSDFARRKTTTRGRSVAMPVWFCLSWIGPCSLSANPEIVLAGPEGRKQEIGHYGTEANAGKKKKKLGKLTLVFWGHGRPLCFSSISINSAHQDKVKQQPLRGVAPRTRMSRNVEEAELLRVLQRRRRVMEDSREPNTSTLTQGTLCCHPSGFITLQFAITQHCRSWVFFN